VATELLSESDFRFLQRLLRQTCGLMLPEKRRSQVADAVSRRMAELQVAEVGQYRRLLESSERSEELRLLAGRLTVGETYFFRHPDQWRVLQRCVIPWIVAQRQHAADRRLRLWSAGCSTGEEAYTLAIVARQALQDDPGWRIEVFGTDINQAAIATAKEACFSARSFRGVPEGIRTAYFERTDRGYRPIPEIRRLVRFECLNLLDDSSQLRAMDVIFCRNVLIHFDPESARRVVRGLYACLRPDGYLFVGQSERLERRSDDFATIQVGRTFFYRPTPNPKTAWGWKGRGADREACSFEGPSRWTVGLHPRPDDQSAEPGRRSIVPLASGSPLTTNGPLSSTSPAPSTPPASWTAWKLGRSSPSTRRRPWAPAQQEWNAATASPSATIESLRAQAMAHLCADEWEAAAAALDDLLRRAPDDIQALLGHAVLRAGQGDCDAVERSCRRVLAKDPFCAEAHYLLALVYETKGDELSTRKELEKSVYLDRHFAAASFRLGCLLEQLGRTEAASGAYRCALESIDRDSEWRIRLYSGGFEPATFRRLCEDRLRSLAMPQDRTKSDRPKQRDDICVPEGITE